MSDNPDMDHGDPSASVSAARKGLASAMAQKNAPGGSSFLSDAAGGAAVGGNLGSMLGAALSSGHNKKQALDTGGNGVMSYFGGK